MKTKPTNILSHPVIVRFLSLISAINKLWHSVSTCLTNKEVLIHRGHEYITLSYEIISRLIISGSYLFHENVSSTDYSLDSIYHQNKANPILEIHFWLRWQNFQQVI